MEVSGQLHSPATLPPGKEPLGTHWVGGWMGPSAGLEMVVKRKIPSPCQHSKHLIIQPIAQCYTTELSQLLTYSTFIFLFIVILFNDMLLTL
jgi:hypothetical protein